MKTIWMHLHVQATPVSTESYYRLVKAVWCIATLEPYQRLEHW